ncbi:MAG: hypothetical protein HYZ45_12920 [Burkholderiales bacterium]|nr:hypothetical protein [Burkholderiales bacterium]
MKGKFTAYAIMVIVLSSALSWGRMLGGSSSRGPSLPGSTWSSNTGSGSWGGTTSGTGHK